MTTETQLVEQPSAMPTNKLMVGVAVTVIVTVLLREFPIITEYFPETGREYLEILVGGLAGLVAGWFKRDADNTPEGTTNETAA